MHVSSGNRGWLWKEPVLMQKMLKSGVPWPSHMLGVALATGWLHRWWCPETDLTSSRWDAVSGHWHRRQESCTHALASSPRFCIKCACPQIMCAKYYELTCMFKKTESRQSWRVCLMQCQNSRFLVCNSRDDNVITSKPTWKLKHTDSILEYSEYFCQISSKSLLVILSYTVLKLRRFFSDTV